ncbi:MAG: toxin-antitoxin system YwqK family antitoxin [Flavobacteriaceae bacterium]
MLLKWMLFIFISATTMVKAQRKDTLFFENNTIIKATGWIHQTVKDSLWVYFHRNGSIEKKGFYSKGKKEGSWEYYLPNGRPSHKNWFVNDQLIKHENFLQKNGDFEMIVITKDSLD